jgi:bifunctional polynucleotide phosphatase/kinase
MEDSVLTFLEPDDMASFAIFDYDHTLVKPREGRRFPKDINDWEWLCPSVPATLKEIAGYCHLVIVTDQSKEWKVTQIENVIGGLHIPATVIIGVERQKPDTSLFLDVFPDFLEKEARTAFYVGDAAGRKGDWSDKDRIFAERLGVEFNVPEDFFPRGVKLE